MEVILKLLMSNPEAIVPTVKEYIEKYKPILYGLMHEMLEIYKDYSNNTEYPSVAARVKKNMYDAYILVGFSEDQALALMINDNIQLQKQLSKQVSSSVSKISKSK